MNDPLWGLAIMAWFVAAVGLGAAAFGSYKLRQVQTRLEAERQAELKATRGAKA
jgi:hypothetical protein